MESSVVSAVLFIMSIQSMQTLPCPGEKCNYKIIPFEQYSFFFYINEKPLKTFAKTIAVENRGQNGCYINTTEVVQDLNLTNEPVVFMLIQLVCSQMNFVDFTPFVSSKLENAIVRLEIFDCNISSESMEKFLRTMHMRFLYLNNSHFSNPCDVTPSECVGLRETALFFFFNSQHPPPDFTNVFSCTKEFPEMAQVSFTNMSWMELPIFLQQQFINLQALEVPYNKFIVPPYFPWTGEEYNLPRNLSQRKYVQFDYSGALGGAEPTKIYGRYFNLDHNQISDLRKFSFHGYLHMLTIKANNLAHVGINTFRNISGLQHLDLSQNKLEHIPVGLFDGLSTLRYLNLQSNKIQELGTGLFNDLRSLECLHIANNSISFLQKGLLSRLSNLEVLYLEYNNISLIETDAFPLDSIALKAVYLKYNPLLSLPGFIFWIRSLFLVDLRSTQITLSDFGNMLESIEYHRLAETVVKSSCTFDIDLKKTRDLRFIDLTNARVEELFLSNVTLLREMNVGLILKNYYFKLDLNPLSCNCKILQFQNFINELFKSKVIEGDEYYFKDLKCETPIELKGRRMMDIRAEETYCEINVSMCPKECSCYERNINKNVIVDCRWRNLSDVHDVMPEGDLELWYSGNYIRKLKNMYYFRFVKVLDLSENSISKLETSAIKNIYNLQKMYLHSNLLADLPTEVADIRFETLTLKNNPFRCNCRTLWMKDWIVKYNRIIIDWMDTKCNDKNEEGRHFLLVPDSEFVCDDEFDYNRYVLIPAVTSTILLFVAILLIILIYTYRQECKVLLYINCGIHPFDKETKNEKEEVDAVIVHSDKMTDWVMNHIIDVLEGRDHNFRICDMARDFVVGFSFQENLNQVVRHSKRMILILSEDWKTDDKTFKVAWNIAQEKIKESKSNFGIIVTHGVTRKQVKDKTLLRFMKRGRHIDSKHRLFIEKILYSMPIIDKSKRQERKSNIRSLIHREFSIHEDRIKENRCHAFISYSDQDLNFLLTEVFPKLVGRGYKLCLPDRDFIPGASKQENILNAIDGAMRTIFVLSGSHINDEWSLFTFRAALEKSLREKSNYLIVIVRENVDLGTLDDEVQHYLKTYICLHVKDKRFWSKLLNGLPPTIQTCQNSKRSTCADHNDAETKMKDAAYRNDNHQKRFLQPLFYIDSHNTQERMSYSWYRQRWLYDND